MNWQKGVIRRYSKKQPLFRDIEENYVTLKNHISLFLVKQKLLELFLERTRKWLLIFILFATHICLQLFLVGEAIFTTNHFLVALKAVVKRASTADVLYIDTHKI